MGAFGLGGASVGHFLKPGGAVFDPATLNLKLWNRASYGGAPWAGTASAGNSGTRSLVHDTTDPAVGTALNGFTPADCSGGAKQLKDATSAWSDLVDVAAYTIIILFKAASAAAPGGFMYVDKAFLSDTTGGAYIGACFSTSGFGVYHLDSAYTGQYVAASTSAWHLGTAKYDGTNLKVRVDSGSYSSVAKSNISSVGGAVGGSTNHIRFEDTYTGPQNGGVDALVAEVLITNTALSDANCDNIKSYINARYGLSL